ncbi:MAG: hypothetical protein P4L46_00135 [Fimbriimonas sp.]|nr:hypothetical protein [Fimbriimonas sp.]
MGKRWTKRVQTAMDRSVADSVFPGHHAVSEEGLRTRRAFLDAEETRLAEDSGTKAAYERTVNGGISRSDAKLLIAGIVAIEVQRALENQEIYGRGTYLRGSTISQICRKSRQCQTTTEIDGGGVRPEPFGALGAERQFAISQIGSPELPLPSDCRFSQVRDGRITG